MIDTQQLYLNLLAAWGDSPLDEPAVKELLEEALQAKQWIDSNFIHKSDLKEMVDDMQISTRHEIKTNKSQIGAVDGYNQALTDLLTKLEEQKE